MFSRALEMLLINWEATWFAITDTKLYVPVVTLSTNENSKLPQQLKLDLKSTIIWNNHQPKVIIQAQN